MFSSNYSGIQYLEKKNGGNGLLIPDSLDIQLRIAPCIE